MHWIRIRKDVYFLFFFHILIGLNSKRGNWEVECVKLFLEKKRNVGTEKRRKGAEVKRETGMEDSRSGSGIVDRLVKGKVASGLCTAGVAPS